MGNVGLREFMWLSERGTMEKEVVAFFFLSSLLVKAQTLKRAEKNPKGDILIIELHLLGRLQCVEKIAFHISQRSFVLLLLPQDCKHHENASI